GLRDRPPPRLFPGYHRLGLLRPRLQAFGRARRGAFRARPRRQLAHRSRGLSLAALRDARLTPVALAATLATMAIPRRRPAALAGADRLQILQALERKVLWLSTWMIHNANHLRPNRDGLKVGGHQSSCASAVTALTALCFHALRPEDRLAVKPH